MKVVMKKGSRKGTLVKTLGPQKHLEVLTVSNPSGPRNMKAVVEMMIFVKMQKSLECLSGLTGSNCLIGPTGFTSQNSLIAMLQSIIAIMDF